MTVPQHPKIVHIVHVDRLPSIIDDGHLWCDEKAIERSSPGTTIGIGQIKAYRLSNHLPSYPDLRVGSCVPFYFWPRSIMLYVIARGNHPKLTYKGGQEPIVHLVADLRRTITWAEKKGLRWVFTLSNAGAAYFEDRCRLEDLKDVDWDAVKAQHWRDREVKEHKQSEFLVESCFPWSLIDDVGVMTEALKRQVASILPADEPRPNVGVKRSWYY